jgi:hypothetical protein
MKSLMHLWKEVAQDLGDLCHVSTKLDFKTVESRSEFEGLSFLTITLPRFGKDFERSLSQERVDHDAFAGFRRRAGLPLFLGGFLDQIFDRKTGVVLDTPSVEAVLAVRQLTRLFSKVELDCTEERKARAFQLYVECEQELEASQHEWTPAGMLAFSRVARLLFAGTFTLVDHAVAHFELVPKHGPGATADRLSGNAKYDLKEWTERLESVFPSSDYLIPNHRYYANLSRVEFLEPGTERPVKVIDVPKTLETPRIIAIEPTCMQFAQQAVSRQLTELLQRDSVAKRFLGFRDNKPNQGLARIGSVDGSLATLDLSEASDRVSNKLVELLFASHGHLREAVAACRSLRADVPGHGVIPLTKFASMGSALTFPVESMVFLTLVFMGIERAHGIQLSRRSIKDYIGKVRVYGDDIVCPADTALDVIETLESFGFKVNRNKSFWSGNFRESCGKDYFKGYDVSVVKARRVFPSSRLQTAEVISMVKMRNHFAERLVYPRTVEFLDLLAGEVLDLYPRVGPDSPIIGRVDPDGFDVERICPRLHEPQVRGYVARPTPRPSNLDGVGALMKYFLNTNEGLPVLDKEHLQFAGRPLSVGMKRAWARSV